MHALVVIRPARREHVGVHGLTVDLQVIHAQRRREQPRAAQRLVDRRTPCATTRRADTRTICTCNSPHGASPCLATTLDSVHCASSMSAAVQPSPASRTAASWCRWAARAGRRASNRMITLPIKPAGDGASPPLVTWMANAFAPAVSLSVMSRLGRRLPAGAAPRGLTIDEEIEAIVRGDQRRGL